VSAHAVAVPRQRAVAVRDTDEDHRIDGWATVRSVPLLLPRDVPGVCAELRRLALAGLAEWRWSRDVAVEPPLAPAERVAARHRLDSRASP